ncbi:MAG: LysM peptidoglycan-binding domain-containing protein, partial [Anaerolineae bacterium]|nr:LysM peptidoglycan-binding domain-containing protein [Anaerolineae bacterium]
MDEDRSLVRSAANALQRVVGEYLGGQPDHDLRWRIIIIIGRYTSHIAIIAVAIVAVLLAGARLNTAKVNVETAPGGPAGAIARPDVGNPALGDNVLSPIDPNSPVAARNTLNSRNLFALYSQQHHYATLANQDDGLIKRFALPSTVKQVEERRSVFTYTVQPGDTIEGLSNRFGLEPSTLAWSNPEVEEDPDHLSLGQILTILPVDGVYYKVESGDTLDSIAKKFKAKTEEIAGLPYNNLNKGANVVAGTLVIVPNGLKPVSYTHLKPPPKAPAKTSVGPGYVHKTTS